MKEAFSFLAFRTLPSDQEESWVRKFIRMDSD